MKFTHSIPSSSPSLWGRVGVGLLGLLLILSACITEFEIKNIDEVSDILVVEGFITDDESVITLSRSKGISFEDNPFDLSPYRVTDAKVYIECDDGAQWDAANQNSGEYAIQTGKLNPELRYRLKIELDEHEYQSEFAYPMTPPEIDTLFWTKRERTVNIHVATHAPDDMVQYYRWTYREEWETRSKVYLRGYPFFCITDSKSREILLGTTEGSAFGQTNEIIAKISPGNDRFKFLYRINVSQYAISKRAYDYYSNVKKNARQTGSFFARVPSEMKGNITCTSDPDRTVIGYMDVSFTTQKRMFIYNSEVYEDPELSIPDEFRNKECAIVYFPSAVPNYVPYLQANIYILRTCVDCQAAGGRSIRELPEDWPNQYVPEDWD